MSLLDTKEGREIARSLAQWSELAIRMNASIDPLHEPTLTQSIAAALLDPAKLAEMLASEGRRLGLWARIDTWHEGAYSPTVGDIVRTRTMHTLVFDDPHNSDEHEKEWMCDADCEHDQFVVYDNGLPRARSLLATWLSLPGGAREEAERALRVGS